MLNGFVGLRVFVVSVNVVSLCFVWFSVLGFWFSLCWFGFVVGVCFGGLVCLLLF